MKTRKAVASVALLVLLSMSAMATTTGRYDQQIQQAVSRKMHDSRQMQNVESKVEDGIVTLTGTVNLYQEKLDAAKRAKVENVAGVRNDIVVSGESVSDAELQQKLAKKLEYDRVGYFDNAFNYIAVTVQDGVVTLNGDAYWGPARDSAMAIVARTAGVKDVVNNVKILPTSNFDDSIRVQMARAIYRDSVLGRYGIDPVDPIRIIVDNGHVTLYGKVQSTMDKNIAGIRANAVPGAFSVDNKLVVD